MADSAPPPQQVVVQTQSKSNGLGVAGFVLSLLGLFTCGLTSLLGVILSAIGMRREPKGLAIAGLVLGLITVLGWVVAIVVGVAAPLLAMAGLASEAAIAIDEIPKPTDLDMPRKVNVRPKAGPRATPSPRPKRGARAQPTSLPKSSARPKPKSSRTPARSARSSRRSPSRTRGALRFEKDFVAWLNKEPAEERESAILIFADQDGEYAATYDEAQQILADRYNEVRAKAGKPTLSDLKISQEAVRNVLRKWAASKAKRK